MDADASINTWLTSISCGYLSFSVGRAAMFHSWRAPVLPDGSSLSRIVADFWCFWNKLRPRASMPDVRCRPNRLNRPFVYLVLVCRGKGDFETTLITHNVGVRSREAYGNALPKWTKKHFGNSTSRLIEIAMSIYFGDTSQTPWWMIFSPIFIVGTTSESSRVRECTPPYGGPSL